MVRSRYNTRQLRNNQSCTRIKRQKMATDINSNADASRGTRGAGGVCAGGKEPIRAMLMHLGHNMWGEWLPRHLWHSLPKRLTPDLKLRVKEELWRRATDRMVERKLNMIVIDIGEGLVYPSHPELAIEGSWPAEKLRAEVERLRAAGLEPIPKLNFSASHDGWLKDYHRMLTLPEWYTVAKDVIRDVSEIFSRPRFFHLGWDEETALFAAGRDYFVMRQRDLWWHDFLYTVACVEALGSRAWVWSDFGWEHEEFFTRCPRSVVQSNWYYDEQLGQWSLDPNVNRHAHRLAAFDALEKAGFDQIPCGTNWAGAGARKRQKTGGDDIIGALVPYCRKHISSEHLLGFLMAPWANCCSQENLDFNLKGIDLFAEALKQKERA